MLKKANVKTHLIDSLWILKDLGLVSVNTPKRDMKKQDTDGNVVIEIFPAISCVCDMDIIKELEEKLNDLISGMSEAELEGENENE